MRDSHHTLPVFATVAEHNGNQQKRTSTMRSDLKGPGNNGRAPGSPLNFSRESAVLVPGITIPRGSLG